MLVKSFCDCYLTKRAAPSKENNQKQSFSGAFVWSKRAISAALRTPQSTHQIRTLLCGSFSRDGDLQVRKPVP